LGWSAIIDLPYRDIRVVLWLWPPDMHRAIGEICHSEPRVSEFLMRKRQAAISGRGRTASHSGKMWISSLLSRV
jgi:hypothetical protein